MVVEPRRAPGPAHRPPSGSVHHSAPELRAASLHRRPAGAMVFELEHGGRGSKSSRTMAHDAVVAAWSHPRGPLRSSTADPSPWAVPGPDTRSCSFRRASGDARPGGSLSFSTFMYILAFDEEGLLPGQRDTPAGSASGHTGRPRSSPASRRASARILLHALRRWAFSGSQKSKWSVREGDAPRGESSQSRRAAPVRTLGRPSRGRTGSSRSSTSSPGSLDRVVEDAHRPVGGGLDDDAGSSGWTCRGWRCTEACTSRSTVSVVSSFCVGTRSPWGHSPISVAW